MTSHFPAKGEDVQGEILKPSIVNTPLFRALTLGGSLLAAARSESVLSQHGVAFLHLFAFSTALGTLVWVTFIAGIVMFKNLPRQTFGRLQSRLFPIYFALTSTCTAVQIGTLRAVSGGVLPRTQLVVLGAGLIAGLANWLVVEPITTGLMFRRYALENADGPGDGAAIKALYKKFGAWHGVTSILNLGSLAAAVAHAWFLASGLRFAP